MLKEKIDLTIPALTKIAGGGGAGRSGQSKRRKVSRGVAGGDQKVSLLGWVRGEMTAGLGACSCWSWCWCRCSTDLPLPLPVPTATATDWRQTTQWETCAPSLRVCLSFIAFEFRCNKIKDDIHLQLFLISAATFSKTRIVQKINCPCVVHLQFQKKGYNNGI